MNLTSIKSSLTKVAGRTGLVLKKYSPEILLVVGITGSVASAVLACRATLRVGEVLDEHNAKIDKIGECWQKIQDGDIEPEKYSEQDHKRDLTVTYVQTAVDFIKLYGPAVTLGAVSIACIVGGHGIMKKRNVALVAAYKAVEEGFNNYRKRVREEYGEDVDYMFKNNLHAEEVTETVTDEDGKETEVKKTKLATNENSQPNIYARFFDETCSQWSKTPEYNLMYLHAQQNYFNTLLQARGHVFLNEVYDALGIPRSSAGAVVGWVLNKDGSGDNFIDFGVFDGDNFKSREFVNGIERSILLDFNVDGTIYDKI